MPYGIGAYWGGKAGSAASVTWQMEYTSSPATTGDVRFEIAKDAKGYTVAQALERAWNGKYPEGPAACTKGPIVQWETTVTRMSFTVDGKTTDLPGDQSSVQVVPGLNVKNTDGPPSPSKAL